MYLGISTTLKAGVDLDSLTHGKIGGVYSSTRVVLLIRTTVNCVSLKYQSLRENLNFSAASELYW